MKKNWILVFSMVCFAITGITHLTACNEEEIKKSDMEFNIREMSTKLHYYKDANTQLCFAGMNLSMQSATMTNVPCTPEVEKIAHSFTSDK